MTYLDSETEDFVMDDLGNRTGIQTLRGGGTDDYSVDSLTNRYTAIDASPLAYDAAGNLTRDKDGCVYGYDYENRIVEIRSGANALIAQMDYDTQGRRVRVYDAAAGTETLYYYSDQWQVLQEHNGTSFTAYYVYGNYIDKVLLMHRAGADVFYLHDHLYSPVALLNTTGSIVERYEYDAYGKASVLASDFSPRSSSGYGNRILFTGREVDSLDNGSLPLQYNRYRYLSQYMGRWCSHDALEYLDGLSLYQCVASNPVRYLDNFGTSYKFGVIPPPWGLADAWKESQDEYNSDTAEKDEWWLMQNIRVRVELMLMGSSLAQQFPFVDLSDAIRLLRHYQSNAGGEVSINLGKMVWQSESAKAHTEAEIDDAIAFVLANKNLFKLGARDFVSENESAGSIGIADSPNWHLAIGSYTLWGRGNAKCDCWKCDINFTLTLRDLYDWNVQRIDRPLLVDVSQAEMALMHYWGAMQNFKVKGQCKTKIKIRWFVNESNAVGYTVDYGTCK